MSEPPCTTTITRDGGLPTLPATGVDPTIMVVLVLIAAALLMTGAGLAMMRYRRVGPITVLVGATFAVCALTFPAPAAHAAQTPSACALFRVSEMTGSSADALTPGRPASGVRYDLTNVTTQPIDIQITTATTATVSSRPEDSADTAGVAGSPGVADQIEASITIDDRPQVAAPLAQGPTTPMVTLSPGATVTVAYTLTLSEEANNTGQGHRLLYDSTITATQP